MPTRAQLWAIVSVSAIFVFLSLIFAGVPFSWRWLLAIVTLVSVTYLGLTVFDKHLWK
jgi:hypothetical protein